MIKKPKFFSKYICILLLSLIFLPSAASAQTGFSVQSDGDNQLYSIDLQTGDATPIGPTGFPDIECLTFNPSGSALIGVSDGGIDGPDQLVSCNPATGACELIGTLNILTGQCGLAFDCEGNLYLSSGHDENMILYSVDPQTAQATAVGPQGEGVTGLTAREGDETCPSGVFGLGVGFAAFDPVSLGCMNLTTGAYEEIGPINQLLFCGGLSFDFEGVLWGINDSQGPTQPNIFTINPENGDFNIVSTTLDGFEGFAIAPSRCIKRDIPTLNQWGLIATAIVLGTIGFIVIRRRKLAV